MKKYNVDINELWNIARCSGCETKTDIAAKMHMNRNTIAKVLNGEELPSSSFMYRFAEVFNIDAKTAGKIFFKHNLHVA